MIKVILGSVEHYSDSSKDVLGFAQFRDDLGTERTWGSFFSITGGIIEHNFDTSNGGFIGIYGNYTDMLNSIGPYYNPGLLCTCDETILVSQALETMAASLTTGAAST